MTAATGSWTAGAAGFVTPGLGFSVRAVDSKAVLERGYRLKKKYKRRRIKDS